MSIQDIIPVGWWLAGLREARSKVTFVGDTHVPLGYFLCELQHEQGGMLTYGKAPTAEAAVVAAAAEVRRLGTRRYRP